MAADGGPVVRPLAYTVMGEQAAAGEPLPDTGGIPLAPLTVARGALILGALGAGLLRTRRA